MKMSNRTGKGLTLSRRFFELYEDTLLKAVPELSGRMAAGLCGEGSECYGFDDEVSEDHDFDPGFCLWLLPEDYEKYGFRLYRAYEKLPREFEGRKRLPSDFIGPGRKGVFSIPEFYGRLLGCSRVPEDPMDWFRIPEYALSQATNGAVFRDPPGSFSRIREQLLLGYPQDVKLKKIAARAALMAQSGQYNYRRCLDHGEQEAAALSLQEFSGHCLAMLFLLNDTYMPYYKWQFRLLRELPFCRKEAEALSELILRGPLKEGTGELVEEICKRIGSCLREQGLSDSPSDFLEAQGRSVTERIRDGRIRNMHLMEGV